MSYSTLEDVVRDEAFPELDLALRRGRHVDRDDAAWYELLSDAGGLLEEFYRRYGCELIHKSDGYFYLLPTGERLGRRHFSSAEMLVGQALTLLYLDPATVRDGGLVSREQLLGQLASAMGAEALVRSMNPKRRRYDERVAEETVRTKVAEATRRLAALGFVEQTGDQRLRLRPALLRFAEPVRGAAAPEASLEQLVQEGELVLAEGESDFDELDDEVDVTPEDDDDATLREVEQTALELSDALAGPEPSAEGEPR